jgi:hypothetical protein
VEKICDEFIIIRQGYILIQQNLGWIKETYLLVRLAKNEVEGDKLKFFSSYLREKNLFLEMLVEKSRLQELEKFLGRSISLDTKAQLDLEKIFFFFAGGTLKASFR